MLDPSSVNRPNQPAPQAAANTPARGMLPLLLAGAGCLVLVIALGVVVLAVGLVWLWKKPSVAKAPARPDVEQAQQAPPSPVIAKPDSPAEVVAEPPPAP